MSDDPVSRGKFLKAFGRSMTGYVLGGAVGTVAQVLSGRAATLAAKSPAPALTAPKAAAENPVLFVDRGDAKSNHIALTFDDGPTPGVTERILDELKQRHLSATFFMIGEHVAAAPELARRVLAEGHEIGNHTYTHPKLTTLPDAQVENELQKTQEIFTRELNYRSKWFRPPYGEFRKNQNSISQDKGLGVVLWSVDAGDWTQPGEDRIVESILSQAQAGSIVLCHDKFSQTADCLGRVLDKLLERGFTFVTISTLVGHLHPNKSTPQPAV